MAVSLHNEIEIRTTARDLYNYVTQPWLWHEWHPSSKSAKAGQSFLANGDEFEEIVEVQPLAPLPFRMLRHAAYTVTESVPFHTWEATGKTKDGWIRIRYDFEQRDGSTIFTRALDFDVKGPYRILLPLIRSQMEKISMIALNNLKHKIQDKTNES